MELIFFHLVLLFIFGRFRHRGYRSRWDNWKSHDRDGDSRKESRTDREVSDRQREEQLNLLETRVAELESRLDYAERLLSQRREADPIAAS